MISRKSVVFFVIIVTGFLSTRSEADVNTVVGSAGQQCSSATSVASLNFDLPRYHSSTSWQRMTSLETGEYQLVVESSSDLSGHTLNFTSGYSAAQIYSQISIVSGQQESLTTSSNTNIVFITNPAGSSGVSGTLHICDSDDGPPLPPIGDPTGLPKRTSDGTLITAQLSGVPLSTAFVTSNMGYWYNHPGVNGRLSDACVDLHDSYWTEGPDGKAYATWHPPVDSEGGEQCFFGHEHGDDPSSSPFYNQPDYADQRDQGLIPIPFGYANEVFAGNGGNRHEDHFGHKIFRENFRMAYGNSVGPNSVTSTGAVCDAVLKLHQGTHSSDGLSNHMHESIAHISCDSLPGYPASRAHVTALVPIGRPGWFSNNCSGGYSVPGQTAGTRGTGENNAPTGISPTGLLPLVLGSPLQVVDLSNATQEDIDFRIDGERIIAGAGCINTWQDDNSSKINNRRFGHAMNDTWVRPLTISNSQGSDVRFYLKSYYSVFNPSRVFSMTNSGSITTESSVDVCRNPPVGQNIPTRPSGLCEQVLADSSITVFADTSPYNGTIRNLNFKTLDITNHSGSTSMWTDAFGRETNSTNPAMAIPQYVSTGYNGASAGGVAGTLATTLSNKVCRPDSGPYPSFPQTDDCYWDGNDDMLFAKEWWRDFSSPSLRVHSPN